MIISLTLIVRPSSLAISLRRTTVALELAQPPLNTVTVFTGEAVLQPMIAGSIIEANNNGNFMFYSLFFIVNPNALIEVLISLNGISSLLSTPTVANPDL